MRYSAAFQSVASACALLLALSLPLSAAAEGIAAQTRTQQNNTTSGQLSEFTGQAANGAGSKQTATGEQRLASPDSAAQQTPAAPRRVKIGLALGGGGTRGLAHVGVLRVLSQAGIHPDCIAGTSMGAIVGGMYAAGKTPDEIERLMREKAFVRSYDTVPIPVRVALIPIFFVPHLFGYHPYDGLYRGNRFASFLTKTLPADRRNIEQAKVPFCAVASNLLDGKPYAITHGSLGKALQASSAIPGLRRPVFWQDKLFVDGGVNANVPVDQCRAMGADIVIAVNVDEALVPIPDKHFRKIGSVAYRCLNMHLQKIDEHQLSNADVVIHPDVNGIQLLSRKIKDLNAALLEGEKATKEALPLIQQEINKKLCITNGEGQS